MKKALPLILALLLLTSCSVIKNEIPDGDAFNRSKDSIIVPYIEKSKVYYSQYGASSRLNSYGFCNLDGETVILPRDDISTFNCLCATDGFCLYQVGIGQSDTSTNADGFDPEKTLIIPANGEWCLELDEVGWWTVSAGDGAIFASLDGLCEYGNYKNYIYQSKTLIFDYDGNLIKEYGPAKFVSQYSKQYKDCVEIELIDESFQNSSAIYVNALGREVEKPEFIEFEYTPKNTKFDDLPYTDNGYDFVCSSDDERFVVYVVGEANYENYKPEEDTRQAYLYDTIDKKVLYSLHGNSFASFIGNNDRYVYTFNYDGIEHANQKNHCLYDTYKKELVIEGADDIIHFGIGDSDFFAVVVGNCSKLFDGDMNIIKTTYFE